MGLHRGEKDEHWARNVASKLYKMQLSLGSSHPMTHNNRWEKSSEDWDWIDTLIPFLFLYYIGNSFQTQFHRIKPRSPPTACWDVHILFLQIMNLLLIASEYNLGLTLCTALWFSFLLLPGPDRLLVEEATDQKVEPAALTLFTGARNE